MYIVLSIRLCNNFEGWIVNKLLINVFAITIKLLLNGCILFRTFVFKGRAHLMMLENYIALKKIKDYNKKKLRLSLLKIAKMQSRIAVYDRSSNFK